MSTTVNSVQERLSTGGARDVKFLFNADIDPFKFFPDSDRWNFPHIRFFTKESFVRFW